MAINDYTNFDYNIEQLIKPIDLNIKKQGTVLKDGDNNEYVWIPVNDAIHDGTTTIPTDATVAQGDSVETSGLGGIYPKGIHIGTVKKVTNTQNMTDRYALVETAVDFNKLNTVLVVKNN